MTSVVSELQDGQKFFPGTRVSVWDSMVGKCERGTVVNWYAWRAGYSNANYVYGSLIDVDFDHRGLSKGHFTSHVEVLCPEIPPMVHPLGRYWNQPRVDDILVDDNYAIMSKSDFDKLLNYSSSTPSGAYEGKMWKRNVFSDWFLYWYSESKLPNMVSINKRKILIA